MKFSYLTAILYTAICPDLYDEVYNYNFIYNHHSDSVKIEFTFPLMEAEFTEFDVDLVNRIIPIDAAVADILAPILLPIDAGLAQVALNERYSFYYCGQLDLLESVESHLIHMTCHDIKNCYLFLVNTQNKYVLSSVLLSQRFFYSESEHGHFYAELCENTFSTFESIVFIDDVFIDDVPGEKLPLWFRIKSAVLNLFSKKRPKYDFRLKFHLDDDGYLHYDSELALEYNYPVKWYD